MKNRILAWLGLTTTLRARLMSRQLFDFYLSEHPEIKKEENIKLNIWWSMEFDRLMKLGTENIVVTNKENQ